MRLPLGQLTLFKPPALRVVSNFFFRFIGNQFPRCAFVADGEVPGVLPKGCQHFKKAAAFNSQLGKGNI